MATRGSAPALDADMAPEAEYFLADGFLESIGESHGEDHHGNTDDGGAYG